MKPALSRTRRAALYTAGWLPLLLLYAVMLRQSNVAPTAALALMYSISYIAPAIAVGAVTWRIARRVAWRQSGWARCIGIELMLGLGFVVSWQIIFLSILSLLAGRDTALANARELRGWPLLMVLLIAAIHATIFHAVRIFGALRVRELAAAEAEALRVRAEMLALRGQLDPHFLFNSLHSITALVREDPIRAEDALLQFAALLRRVLAVNRDSSDEVTLADEMRFVHDYLAIERLRLGERLRVDIEVSGAALECRLPAFSVQPLVENSIRHAIAPRRDGGTIGIHGAIRDGRLVISVNDDGAGAHPAAVGRAIGVGLSVIRQRLALRHGARAALTVDTAVGKGFLVTLTLPAETVEFVA